MTKLKLSFWVRKEFFYPPLLSNTTISPLDMLSSVVKRSPLKAFAGLESFQGVNSESRRFPIAPPVRLPNHFTAAELGSPVESL
jgi:hypothetical protein